MAIGTIFSDIDHPRSTINSKVLLVKNGAFKVITYLMLAFITWRYGKAYLSSYEMIGIIVIFIAIAFSKHRGLTHSIPGIIGLWVFFKGIHVDNYISIPFLMGMASHILLDMFNPEGVELVWPIPKKFKFPLTVETGHFGENIFAAVFFVALAYIFYAKGMGINEVFKFLKM